MRNYWQILRAWITGLLMPVLFFSCSSYNTKLGSYYKQVSDGKYEQAMQALDQNSFIKSNRNLLLYYLEKGKLYHRMHLYDSSNAFFNRADFLIENTKKSAGDVAKSYLLNPMLQTYLGEDFERFMVHYYKGLNYMYLNQANEAIVEARRITLAQDALFQKYNEKSTRYSKDAFTLNLQGMLYEASGDINDAFIAYRNAADLYLKSNNNYYGVNLPNQLKQDLLRTAQQMGFNDEKERYEKLFNTTLQTQTAEGGELILFIESGDAPVKRERNFMISKDANGVNGFYYIDENGRNILIPFDFSYYPDINPSDDNLKDIRIFRVAMPYYQPLSDYVPPVVTVNDSNVATETAQDLNSLAVNVLNERLLSELANAIARQLVKRLTELAAQKSAEAIAKNNSKGKNDKEKKDNAKEIGEIAGFVMNMINTATEKADTRNWQGLPAYISYVRILLKKGENIITIKGRRKSNTTTIIGTGKLQIANVPL